MKLALFGKKTVKALPVGTTGKAAIQPVIGNGLEIVDEDELIYVLPEYDRIDPRNLNRKFYFQQQETKK